MAKIYDNTDIFWTSRGDIMIGGDGDIQDTEYDPLRSFIQEVKTRLEADKGDWSIHPGQGASIGDFVGEPNNKFTAERIKTRIVSALTLDGFVNTADISVKYMPIDIDRIMFRISFNVAGTAKNRNSTQLIYNLLYNYSDNNVYFVQ